VLARKEAELTEVQMRLGALEAQHEVSRTSCTTWKDDHARCGAQPPGRAPPPPPPILPPATPFSHA
jgi:hypothetical protein